MITVTPGPWPLTTQEAWTTTPIVIAPDLIDLPNLQSASRMATTSPRRRLSSPYFRTRSLSATWMSKSPLKLCREPVPEPMIEAGMTCVTGTTS